MVPLLVVIIGVDDVDVVDALFSAGRFVFEVISTALPSAHAACRRPVSFLRMMQHWIMAPGFQPKERPANRPQGRRHGDWQRGWFAMHAILPV